MPGFTWRMGDYVGGDTAVHQAYKPWLALELEQSPREWATGEFLVQPRDTTDLVFSGLGFEPDVIFLISYRPYRAGGKDDGAFGDRGGGMTFGVGGRSCPDLGQFTGSTRIRHAFEQRYTFWREDACFSVVHDFPLGETNLDPGSEILRLVLDSLDPDGFTLQQPINLYDQTNYIAWLAMKGRFKVGVMTTGDTQLTGVPGTATGAVFLSTKLTPSQANGDGKINRWDHMQGFASALGSQAAIWGGMRDTNWDRTTERWSDTHSILLCDAALSSAFSGAEVLVEGRIWNWFGDSHSVTITRSGSTATVSDTGHGYTDGQCVEIAGANQGAYNGVKIISVTGPNAYEYTVTGSPATPATGTITSTVGGVDIAYDTLNASTDTSAGSGSAFRVGYVLMGDPADSGVIETNWETRPGGTQNDPPGSGTNYQPTVVKPRVVLMQATNYNFSYSNTDPFDSPRSPNAFQFGGSGGLGWHVHDFDDPGTAFGVHTFGNAVAERGRYANSGTQYMRNYILAGQGANSQPPAYHQHSINIIPTPKIVGLNYRYGERHAHVKRIHINPSDQYTP